MKKQKERDENSTAVREIHENVHTVIEQQSELQLPARRAKKAHHNEQNRMRSSVSITGQVVSLSSLSAAARDHQERLFRARHKERRRSLLTSATELGTSARYKSVLNAQQEGQMGSLIAISLFSCAATQGMQCASANLALHVYQVPTKSYFHYQSQR